MEMTFYMIPKTTQGPSRQMLIRLSQVKQVQRSRDRSVFVILKKQKEDQFDIWLEGRE